MIAESIFCPKSSTTSIALSRDLIKFYRELNTQSDSCHDSVSLLEKSNTQEDIIVQAYRSASSVSVFRNSAKTKCELFSVVVNTLFITKINFMYSILIKTIEVWLTLMLNLARLYMNKISMAVLTSISSICITQMADLVSLHALYIS